MILGAHVQGADTASGFTFNAAAKNKRWLSSCTYRHS